MKTDEALPGKNAMVFRSQPSWAVVGPPDIMISISYPSQGALGLDTGHFTIPLVCSELYLVSLQSSRAGPVCPLDIPIVGLGHCKVPQYSDCSVFGVRLWSKWPSYNPSDLQSVGRKTYPGYSMATVRNTGQNVAVSSSLVGLLAVY